MPPAGEIELRADGTVLRIVPLHHDDVVEEDGRLVIPANDAVVDDEFVRALRLADQRPMAT